MSRVRVHLSGVGDARGLDMHVELPGVPRIGDLVHIPSATGESAEYRVRTVVWLLDDERDDAYVVIA
jgi:hypothetical protein